MKVDEPSIDFRWARPSESALIRTFWSKYWDGATSVHENPKVLEYLYRLPNGELSIFLAVERGEIVATLCPIYYGDGDPSCDPCVLTLWCSKPNTGSTGFLLLKEFLSVNRSRCFSTGVRESVLGFYKILGLTTHPMDFHFFRNPCLSEYKLIEPPIPPPLEESSVCRARLEVAASVVSQESATNTLRSASLTAHRNHQYFLRKYSNHPFHDYKFLEVRGVWGSGIGVVRTHEVDGARIMKILDWFGPSEGITPFFLTSIDYCIEWDCEAVYSYSYNLTPVVPPAFELRIIGDRCLVPTHFDPYESVTDDKWCVLSSPVDFLISGDGDGDRPYRTAASQFA